jgi:ankyrin repeat protein
MVDYVKYDVPTGANMATKSFNTKAAMSPSEEEMLSFWCDIADLEVEKASTFLKTHPDAWKIPVPRHDEKGRFGIGWKALHVAAAHGQPDLVRLCMSLGADITEPAIRDKMTPMMMAACWPYHDGSLDVLEMAIEKGGNVDAQNDFGNTALFFAAGINLKHVSLLLEAGADPNIANSVGHTPLIVAASKFNGPDPKIVDALLKHGARVNHADIHGNSALSGIAHCIEVGRQDLFGDSFRAIEAMLKEKSRIELLDEIGQIVTEGTGVTGKPMPLLRLSSPKPGQA